MRCTLHRSTTPLPSRLCMTPFETICIEPEIRIGNRLTAAICRASARSLRISRPRVGRPVDWGPSCHPAKRDAIYALPCSLTRLDALLVHLRVLSRRSASTSDALLPTPISNFGLNRRPNSMGSQPSRLGSLKNQRNRKPF